MKINKPWTKKIQDLHSYQLNLENIHSYIYIVLYYIHK